MYKRDLLIENPKKFQRHVSDVASGVLLNRGYYLSTRYSKFPYLKANGIANIADFHGILCFVKNHSNYNLISRIIGTLIAGLTISYLLYSLISTFDIVSLVNLPAWIGVGIGIFLIFYKFGKDICIEIRLVGESYRTDVKKEENTIEYLGVRSDARLTVQVSTLDPKKTLSDQDLNKLQDDGYALADDLTPFLEPFVEKIPK